MRGRCSLSPFYFLRLTLISPQALMAVAEKRARGSRGKKNKSSKDQDDGKQDSVTQDNVKPGKTFQRKDHHAEVGDENGRPARPDRREQIDNAAIFGFIDPDVQQYFKGVEKTLDEQNFEAVEGILTGCSLLLPHVSLSKTVC